MPFCCEILVMHTFIFIAREVPTSLYPFSQSQLIDSLQLRGADERHLPSVVFAEKIP